MTPPIEYDPDAVHTPVLTFRWIVRRNGDDAQYEASGTCPVCTCPMTRTWPFGQPPVAKGGFFGRREEPGPEPFHTLCQCRTLHMNRPASEPRGCGALLTIAAPPSPGQPGATP
ncbi:hypothetical protein QF034_002002 [Streptomyces africanus]|uniref:Uncharacterized protein n=1 Tax=Streptomyces africanus TaxID=231024 RepID=A0ABU0QK55_9ACTN|nr:hypothetical protein [Streptomyces africanus]MDQ0747771.1 hypothetical protein [Streptomyces africanus]